MSVGIMWIALKMTAHTHMHTKEKRKLTGTSTIRFPQERIASACDCTYLLATSKFQDYNLILFYASSGQKLTTHMNGFSKNDISFYKELGFIESQFK